MNDWAADTDRDALDPWSYPNPARHETMAGHSVAAPRGIAVGLVLLAAFWAGFGGVRGGLLWLINR